MDTDRQDAPLTIVCIHVFLCEGSYAEGKENHNGRYIF